MKKVLVTGGAGFIGSAVIRHLIQEKEWTVSNVDKLTYAANLNSLSTVADIASYTFIRQDICDREAMERVLAKTKPHAIMHLAAETHVDRSITGSGEFVQANIVGTHCLLEAARTYWDAMPSTERDNFRFLHVSTDEVYGTLAPGDFFKETNSYRPRSPYSASKAASDHLVSAWCKTYGLPIIITNCSNNYGPYQFPEKLIPLILLNALENQSLPVYGDGKQERDWLYVEDHVRALTLALERGRVGETYNIGGRAIRTNIAVVEMLCDLLDDLRPDGLPRRRLVTFVTDRPGHDRRYAIDPTKIETELGWQPKETFETGLIKTVEWYLENEPWWRPLRESVYGGLRLGLARH